MMIPFQTVIYDDGNTESQKNRTSDRKTDHHRIMINIIIKNRFLRIADSSGCLISG